MVYQESTQTSSSFDSLQIYNNNHLSVLKMQSDSVIVPLNHKIFYRVSIIGSFNLEGRRRKRKKKRQSAFMILEREDFGMRRCTNKKKEKKKR